jgi:hypothetical protein
MDDIEEFFSPGRTELSGPETAFTALLAGGDEGASSFRQRSLRSTPYIALKAS